MLRRVFTVLLTTLMTTALVAQSLNVTGEVIAADDKLPLMGVNVVVAGVPGQGTITDINGRYSISVPTGKSLVFRYIGYKETTVVVTKAGIVNITMEPDTKMLEEVVAIGYGTMKKSDLTGAISSIKKGDISILQV